MRDAIAHGKGRERKAACDALAERENVRLYRRRAVLERDYPGALIVGAESPPFRPLEKITPEEWAASAEKIAELRRLSSLTPFEPAFRGPAADAAQLAQSFAELEEQMRALKDELARLKGGSGRPPIKPSGMEKAPSLEADVRAAAKAAGGIDVGRDGPGAGRSDPRRSDACRAVRGRERRDGGRGRADQRGRRAGASRRRQWPASAGPPSPCGGGRRWR